MPTYECLFQVIISPILAGLAVGIGVPILLFYVYGVVPVSLCRSGGCGGSSSADDGGIATSRNTDNASMDAVSNRVTNPSIGEASLSLASGSQVLRDADRYFNSLKQFWSFFSYSRTQKKDFTSVTSREIW